MISGTSPSECSGGLCRCDRQTGACPCREHVEGHNCDGCAANHWNFGQAGGCEPCACDPDHSTGAHCNMVTAASASFPPKSNPTSIFCWSMMVRAVLRSSPASATAVQGLGGGSARNVSSCTGETPACSVKVTNLLEQTLKPVFIHSSKHSSLLISTNNNNIIIISLQSALITSAT